ncbi:MAG: DUF1566 domain-containing protein, partial [Pedobacter sp.]
MRKFFLLVIFACCFMSPTFIALAQVVPGVAYQSLIREDGEVAVNKAVVLRISVFQGASTGSPIYRETHSLSTNVEGIVSYVIGSGTPLIGVFSEIDWSNGPLFMKEEVGFGAHGNYPSEKVSKLNSVPYALSASTVEGITDVKQVAPTLYKVGDLAHGGIVFYVDPLSNSGLVCAIADLPARSWYNGVNKAVYTTGDGFGAGKMNSVLQVALQGGDNATASFAAKSCLDYKATQAGVSYGDWYLPSKWELNQMRSHREVINETALKIGGTSFSEGYLYWSSSEFDNSRAWWQRFDATGLQSFDTKNYTLEIRPIRAFSGLRSSATSPSDDQETSWTQKEFVLSTFLALTGSGDKPTYEKILSQTREAGITHVELSFLNTTALRAALDVSEALGVKTLAQDLTKFSGFQSEQPSYTPTSINNEIGQLKNYRFLEGYFIWDEPYLVNLATTNDIKGLVKTADPRRLAFSLCFPSYGPYTWGDDS